jgi:transcriptional regulator with XRE-family HTH domain
MEMNLDVNLIKAEREKRAWSQEHLAAVAGLSLRTVQRVESTGCASFESARAIAVVLERDVATLRASRPSTMALRNRKVRYAAAAASLAAIMFGILSRTAVADQVMLDVGLAMNGDTLVGKSRMITDQGKSAEIRLEGQMRILFVPTINADGSVALAMQVYEWKNQRFELVLQPKVFLKDNQQGAVNVSSPSGASFRIVVTPHKLRS